MTQITIQNLILPPPPQGHEGWPWTGKRNFPQYSSEVRLPRISIITPSYNQGRFLERTLRSVLLQGYPNLEYIVIDGGSQDDSVAIIEKYEKHIDYWVSEKDRGQPHALQKGLSKCTGEIIAFINSDDYYVPETLFRVGELFSLHPDVPWLSGICRYYDEEQNCFIEDDHRYIYQMPPLPDDRSQWVDGWPTNQPSSFWRKLCFDTVGGFREDLDLVFDTEFMIRLLFADLLPMIVDEVFSVYALHDSSKTVSMTKHYANEADGFRRDYYKHLDAAEGQRLYWRILMRGYRHRVRLNQQLRGYGFVLREAISHPVWFAQGLRLRHKAP